MNKQTEQQQQNKIKKNVETTNLLFALLIVD